MATGYALTALRVAFFRNMNLGQARSHSPTSAQLLDAFARAGCPEAANFQSNGTVIFRACGGNENAREVVRLLSGACGYRDAVMVRSARWIVALAARLRQVPPDAEVVLFDGGADPGLPLPWTDPDTGLEFLELSPRHAVALWPPDAPGGSPATRVLTELSGVPVTGRTVRTVRRLATRLLDAPPGTPLAAPPGHLGAPSAESTERVN